MGDDSDKRSSHSLSSFAKLADAQGDSSSFEMSRIYGEEEDKDAIKADVSKENIDAKPGSLKNPQNMTRKASSKNYDKKSLKKAIEEDKETNSEEMILKKAIPQRTPTMPEPGQDMKHEGNEKQRWLQANPVIREDSKELSSSGGSGSNGASSSNTSAIVNAQGSMVANE